MWIDVDELVKILSAGVNVVSSASFITGHNLGEAATGSKRRAEQGGSTMFGSGVSPGFADLLAIVAASAATGSTRSPSPRPPTPPSTTPRTPRDRWASAPRSTTPTCSRWRRRARRVHRGGATGRRLARRRTRRDRVRGRIRADDRGPRPGLVDHPAGCVAGVFASWQGLVGGKTVVDLNVRWRKGQTLDPDWKLDGTAGRSPSRTADGQHAGRLPAAADMIENRKTIEDFFVLGHIMTAMPPIHAIPAVVAAALEASRPTTTCSYPQARGVADERLIRR